MSSRLSRAEDHLERRGLAGLVERDEPRRHRALAGHEVVLGDAAFHAVLAHVPLDVRELELREVVALNRGLERCLEAVQLGQRRSRLGLFRANRGVAQTPGVPRRARDKSLLERTAPAPACERRPLGRGWDGRTGWGRYVTRQDRTRDFGRPSTFDGLAERRRITCISTQKRSISGPGLWYGPPPCSGRHTGRRGACLRPPPSPSPFSPFRRSASPVPGGPRPRSAPRPAALAAKARSATSASTPSTSSSRPPKARLQSLRAEAAALRERRVSLSHQLDDRPPQRDDRAAAPRHATSGRSTSAVTSRRSRWCSALEPRRRADEHRRPEPDGESGRGGPERRQGDARAARPGRAENLGAQAAALAARNPRRCRDRRLAHPLAGRPQRPISSSLSQQRNLTLAQIAAVVARAQAAQVRIRSDHARRCGQGRGGEDGSGRGDCNAYDAGRQGAADTADVAHRGGAWRAAAHGHARPGTRSAAGPRPACPPAGASPRSTRP